MTKKFFLDFRISASPLLPSELSGFQLTCELSLGVAGPVRAVSNGLGGGRVSGEEGREAWEICCPVVTQPTLFVMNLGHVSVPGGSKGQRVQCSLYCLPCAPGAWSPRA